MMVLFAQAVTLGLVLFWVGYVVIRLFCAGVDAFFGFSERSRLSPPSATRDADDDYFPKDPLVAFPRTPRKDQ
jgi:hypothetical protein